MSFNYDLHTKPNTDRDVNNHMSQEPHINSLLISKSIYIYINYMYLLGIETIYTTIKKEQTNKIKKDAAL